MVVYKYEITPSLGLKVTVPKGAQLLSVQEQNGNPCMWCLVDESKAETETWDIEVFGTGHYMPELYGEFSRKHLGTVLLNEGSLVLHLFKVEAV